MAERLGPALAHRRRPDDGLAGAGRRLGRVHPRRRRRDPAGDGQRRTPRGRRRPVLRAAAGAHDQCGRTARPRELQGQRTSPRRAATRRSRAEVARAATDAARCVTGYGAARGSCGGWSTSPMVYGDGRAARWPARRGTTDSNRTAWFVGFTPQLAAARFIADPDNPDNVGGLQPRHDLEVHGRGDAQGRPQGPGEDEVHPAADSRWCS